jgi:hypothetical protein
MGAPAIFQALFHPTQAENALLRSCCLLFADDRPGVSCMDALTAEASSHRRLLTAFVAACIVAVRTVKGLLNAC